jgi:hypothetical protein
LRDSIETATLAVVAAAWLLAGCASFGEGVTGGLLTQSAEPAEDTRMCEVCRPAFAGILPMLEHQAGHPPLGEAGPERPILKVPIETPAFPGETLGQLTVSRHTSPARDREMLF